MVLTLDRETIERVESYTYLGSMVNLNWDQSEEVRCRIEKGKPIFNKMKTFFVRRNLSLKLKIRMVRCYILPVFLYGVEAWTMTEALMRRLESFKMWIYRWILRISWIEHTTNEEVLRRMDKRKEVTFTVKRRKMEYLGHIMRNNKYRLLPLILQEKLTVGEDREGEEIRDSKTCANGLRCHL